MDDSTITYVVLGAAVVLFVVDKVPVAVVAVSMTTPMPFGRADVPVKSVAM